jgi:hypothetical protein
VPGPPGADRRCRVSAPAGALSEITEAPEPRTRSRRKKAAALVAVVVVGTAGTMYAVNRPNAAANTTGAPRVAATAVVERRDLVERESLSGTLEHSDQRDVVAGGQGVMTQVAKEGGVVRRGEALYSVNGVPVRLLYGDLPAYRTLSEGVDDGPDVRQLEQNLVALGYDPDGDIDVDDEFDWATKAAVQRWEEDLGITEDGLVTAEDIVFLPDARRIAAANVDIGSQVGPGAAVLSTTSLKRVVTVDLEVADQDLVEKGQKVQVELPDGRIRRGTISKIGSVVAGGGGEDDSDTGDGSDDTATVEMTVRMEKSIKGFDQAPVSVSVMSSVSKDALAVPVAALLALAEGGYAVEVVDGARTRLVPVDPQGYADGWVEVQGDLTEGQEVVVPE